ncbi:MAG: hypothetical protein AB7I79_04185 [Rhizobiaceae bacterium]
MSRTEPETRIATDKARQGRWGHRVLAILVGGLLLAAVAWWIAEIYGEDIDEGAEQTSVYLLR